MYERLSLHEAKNSDFISSQFVAGRHKQTKTLQLFPPE
jgi:hypothetical protein